MVTEISGQPLSVAARSARFVLGPLTLAYDLDPQSGLVEFAFWPSGHDRQRVTKRAFLDSPEVLMLPARWQPMPARLAEPLVQLHVRGDGPPPMFAQGRTLRNSESCGKLRFVSQQVAESASGLTITTRLTSKKLTVDHLVQWFTGELSFRVWTVVHNTSRKPLTLDMLASFSFSGVTPFHPADAPERLMIHRIRTGWSSEGRLESRLAEDYHLERSWTGHAAFCERFGQVGSLPSRGFQPFVAVEDTAAGVAWGAQLEHAASWQMEIYRRGDDLAVSGGLADREFGHWWKSLDPGQSFTTPTAVLSSVAGDVQDLCHALTSAQLRAARQQPLVEHDLPATFNEWCCSWGNPTHDHLIATARAISRLGFKYLVIDDGWAERPGEDFQQNGDWITNHRAFPLGLKATCEAIRAAGLVPGLWFEFEVCNKGSKAWRKTSHQLHRDGKVLRVGNRRFWDFRDPWTHAYLTKKVIRTLRDNDFGYLRIDYNETIGIGCDGAESPGEGLRAHLDGVKEFLARIRRELPGIVIENCSSGGHRLEPSLQALCAMGSFSDAHETVEIPLIAANLHRLVLPRQTQVWAVLRRGDSRQRMAYSLAATFLGRVTISGDMQTLAPEQLKLVAEALAFHAAAVPILRECRSRRFGVGGPGMRHPRGWQGVRMLAADGNRMLCVIHTFAGLADPDAPQTITIPLPDGPWRIVKSYQLSPGVTLTDEGLVIPDVPPFTGQAVILERGVE